LAKKTKGQLSDYTPFLVKYIEYARQLKPILSEEATIMLEEFYINVKIKGFGSDRVLPTLHKLAKAVARLKLKEVVGEEDAKEVMEFYNVMLVDYQKSVVVSQSPRELAYNECVSILEQIKGFGGITLEDLIKKVCENNEQLANYFQYDQKPLKIKNNRKVRDVYETLLNHSKIKKVQEKPIVLQWLEPDLGDPSDLCDKDKHSSTNNKIENYNENFNGNGLEEMSHTSHRSLSPITIESPDLSDPSDVCDKDKTTAYNNKENEQEKNTEEKINKSELEEQLSHTSHRSLREDNKVVNEYGMKLGTNSKLPVHKISKEQYDSLNGKSNEDEEENR
jgi:hypothetical protein